MARGAERADYGPTPKGNTLTSKTLSTLLVAALIAAVLGAGAWYHANDALDQTRSQLVTGELRPISTMLKENQTLIHELQSAPFTENDSSILDSYLAKIRRDGVSKHADMKRRLDTLAENNTALVTLIKAYATHAKTASFTTEGDKFRNYASAWRDRWNSVMELFMAGGNYAASEVPFPKEFPATVDAEIAAAK
jgi:hypothetical protein